MRKIPSPRLSLGFLGLLLLVLAFWQVRAPAGLDVVRTRAGEIPVDFIVPAGADPLSRPLALVGHGFASSGVIMRGFGYTLARAGYIVAIWDFDGHGANPRPLPAGLLRGDLTPNAEAVWAEAQRLGFGDPTRVAILGHSMGSGVALSFGQQHPATMATIAVSPVGVSVTPELPQNLLLLAGENEPNFVRNAQQILSQAGGKGGDPASGMARRLEIIPRVEHITIVFSPAAHRAAREWLDATFGPQPGAGVYTDRRVLWYGLGVLGALLAAVNYIPTVSTPSALTPSPAWRRVLPLVGGVVVASWLLWLLNRLGVNLFGILGLQVGGTLLMWFAVAGLFALFGLRLMAPGGGGWNTALAKPGWAGGLMVAASLWVGVGLLGGQVWLPWLLILPRLIMWPLGVMTMLPWFLAVGAASYPANGWGRLGWWLGHTLIVLAGLFLTLRFVPSLSVLVLILPVFPLILGAHAFAAGRQRHPWAFALSAALFASWVVLAVFPLS